jgi:hypothetical protein
MGDQAPEGPTRGMEASGPNWKKKKKKKKEGRLPSLTVYI